MQMIYDFLFFDELLFCKVILINYIAVIDVNPERHQNININGARKFIDWLCSLEAQEIIRTFKTDVYGEPLFFPNSAEWHKANSGR
jgi:tungstate transport system substrate-binding protein